MPDDPQPSSTAPTLASQAVLPETIRRIGRLEIRARQVVEGFLSGMHRSPYFGRSLEFREHRQYAPGDDLRHLDWKVWARQDRYYIKQYEEDTNMRASLLVDCSASMAYGDGPLSKYDYAATAACVLAYMLLRNNDAIGCQVFDDRVRSAAPIRSNRTHISAIADALRGEPTSKKTDLGAILHYAATSLPRRGLVVLISDLMGDLAALKQGLGKIRMRGHEVMVLHIMDDDELDFPFEGATQFVALEGDSEISCNPRALKQDYLAAMKRFLAESRRACLSQQADYALIRTSQPLDAALTALISRRTATTRRR